MKKCGKESFCQNSEVALTSGRRPGLASALNLVEESHLVLKENRAKLIAEMIHKNIVDWDLDGVDFYNLDVTVSLSWSGSAHYPGNRRTPRCHLRGLAFRNTKTISYSTISSWVFDSHNDYGYSDPDTAVISAIQPYLNVIILVP